jgi:DNA repair protein RadC
MLSELSTHDLVAAVTQRDVDSLIERVGGLERLARAEAFEIAAHLDERDLDLRDRGEPIDSPKQATLEAARALAAAFELGRRIEELRADLTGLADSDAVVRWAKPRLARLPFEEVWVLAVDGGLHLRAARCIARGGLHSAGLRAADAVRAAIRLDASAFFLVHNHPSGDPTPSREDEVVTQRIAAVAAIADIPLLDHLVVARHSHASVRFTDRDVDGTGR